MSVRGEEAAAHLEAPDLRGIFGPGRPSSDGWSCGRRLLCLGGGGEGGVGGLVFCCWFLRVFGLWVEGVRH